MINQSFAIVIREEGPSFEELADFIINIQPRAPWEITRLDEMLRILAGEENDRWCTWFDDMFAASLQWPTTVFCIVAIKGNAGNSHVTYFKKGQNYDGFVVGPGFDPVKLAIQSRFELETAEYVTARVRSDIAAVLNDLDQELQRRSPMVLPHEEDNIA